MLCNTSSTTFIWISGNRKPTHRRSEVRFIDATQWSQPLRIRGDRLIEHTSQRLLRLPRVTFEGPMRAPGWCPERPEMTTAIKKLKDGAERSQTVPPASERVLLMHVKADPRGRPHPNHHHRRPRRSVIQPRPSPPRYGAGATHRGRRHGSLPAPRGTGLHPRLLERAGERQSRLQDQLHPLLLPATVPAPAGEERG